jgi:hypothetical protein
MIKQIFICQPLGGFIDICNEIIRCLHYCEKNDCFLLIDTRYSSFRMNIYDFFSFFHKSIVIDEDIINNLDLFYENNINEDNFFPKYYYNNFISKNVKKKLVITDLSKTYKEKFIIRSNGAYGPFFYDFLKITKMKENILDILRNRYYENNLNNLFYIGIHIRNTDYKSDFKKFYMKLLGNKEIEKKTNILICSDDLDVINYFFEKKDFCNLYSFSDIPKLENKNIGIHNIKNLDEETKKQINIDLICDLFLLILSHKFYFSSYESGFSKTIFECRKNKKFIKEKYLQFN